MAEEKKPKIDLKARLGKNAAAGSAQAGVPAPVVPPSAAGVIPPPAVGPSTIPTPAGVPVPPFAAASQPQAAPQPAGPAVDPSDPFGAPAAAPVARVQQELKIELGDDVMLAQKRASGKKTLIVAGLVGLAALGIGYAAGGQSQQSAGAKIAVQGAQDLIGEIEKSQEKIKELNEKIGGAIKDLKERKFPENFATDLGGISIPFGADKLAGRNIGRFPPNVLQLLFAYTSQVEALNERKDALKNLFTGQKQGITEALASAGDPKIKFNVIVQKDAAKGPVAVLAPVNPADAWAVKSETWPTTYKISTGRNLVDVERWSGKGEVFTAGAKVLAIPLEPESVGASFPNDVVMRIQSELMKTGTILEGRTGGLPDEEEAGVLRKGELLIEQLKKIGGRE